MAEIASATAGVTNTVIKLSQLLYSEFKFLLDVKDEVELLRSELRWMQSFLKDAENKLDNSNNLIREWVSDVRDLAFEAEDVIDTFHIKLGRESHSSSCISFSKNVPATHELGWQLEKLMGKACEISRRRERYGLTNEVSNPRRSEEKLKELRETNSYAKKEHIIGLGNTVGFLKGRLGNGEPKLCMLSILGMGGLGKTTLARKLYDEVRNEYPYSAWVCVSQEYKTQDLLLRLIDSMLQPPPNALTTIYSMQAYLLEKLKGKKFLIVLDDVWETEAWESICSAFPDETTSSRVIITTRIKDVANLNNAIVHPLEKLNEDDSWKLFCQKISLNDTDTKSQELGKIMVKKCDGLPLAIVTLGGILSKAQGISEWHVVKDNLWKEIEKGTIHINAVLTLSFNFLPDYLKLCYLYVGMFPEDYEIPISKLMLLWEAEGLIEQEEDVSSESKAKLYLNELVGRSLLQETGDDLMNPTCRVHDLLRDLVIKKAKEIKFSAFFGENQKLNLLKTLPPRRLAMWDIDWRDISYSNSSIRTLHLVQKTESYSLYLSQYLSKCLPIRFDLLRVLDIQVFKMPHHHLKVGKLISLRYLGLEAFDSFKVSKTIGDLKDLQTLFVMSGNRTVLLPGTVVKLQNLRNLLGEFKSRHIRIGELAGLTTLEISCCRDWCALDTTKLVNLRHLTLGMWDHETETWTSERFLPNFEHLSELRTLKLQAEYAFDITEIFKRCPRITHLRLECVYYLSPSSSLPGPSEIPFLFDLARHLEVVNWVFVDAANSQTSISSLEKLTKLRALQLSFENELDLDLNISEEAFIQLRTLRIKLRQKSNSKIFMTLTLRVPDSSMTELVSLSVNVPANLIVSDRLREMISAHC